MGFKFSNKVKYEFFTEKFTRESSYVLGLLWADGYVSKKTNSISIECVREDIEYFYTIFSTTGDYNLYFRKRENRRELGLINCSSFELSTFLKDNDYLLKSVNTPSKILSKIPIEFHSYFFLGWSDGDGCFYYNDKKNLIQYIVSGSFEQDWESLIKLCEYLEINYKIDRFKSGQNKYSRFLIHRNNDIIKFGNFIYRDCDKFSNLTK